MNFSERHLVIRFDNVPLHHQQNKIWKYAFKVRIFAVQNTQNILKQNKVLKNELV